MEYLTAESTGNRVVAVTVADASARASESHQTQIVLIREGKSEYVIVVPEGTDPRNRVKQASDLLQKSLMEATGVNLPVVKESEYEAGTCAIYLGMTQAARDAGLPLKKISGYAYLKKVVGKNIFLVGVDEVPGDGDTRMECNQRRDLGPAVDRIPAAGIFCNPAGYLR